MIEFLKRLLKRDIKDEPRHSVRLSYQDAGAVYLRLGPPSVILHIEEWYDIRVN